MLIAVALTAFAAPVLGQPLEARVEWVQAADVGPPAGIAALAYDQTTQRVVHYTSSLANPNSETWTWNGTEWTLLTLDGPPSRGTTGLAFDSALGAIVLFGGWRSTNGVTLNDTWVLTGDAWAQLAPPDVPSVRRFHAITYDDARSRVVMFGGIGDGCGEVRGDTWEFDGTNWTPRSNSGPQPRVHARLAYDPVREECVLFGGVFGCAGGLDGQTWAWDGDAWRVVADAASSPPARRNAAMAFFPELDGIVLFGGGQDAQIWGDTWLWDGSTWTEIDIPGPPARTRDNNQHDMTYDGARHEIILFGGSDANLTPLQDTWALRLVPPCDADLNSDGSLDFFDVAAFLGLFSIEHPDADWNDDGAFDFFDAMGYLQAFSVGCP